MKKSVLFVSLAALLLVGCGGSKKDPKPTPSGSGEPTGEPSAPVSPTQSGEPTGEPTGEPSAPVSPTQSGEPTGEPTGADKKVKIKFTNAYGKDYQPTLNAWIEEFNAAHEDIEVENNLIEGNYTTIRSQTIADMGTGEYGDLVICYPDHVVDYMDYGKAVNMDKFINDPKVGLDEEELDDYIRSFVREGQSFLVEGTYCMPFSKSSEAMFYNADKLVGLNLSDVDVTINNGQPLNETYLNDLTWEELFEKLCPAIVAKNNALDDAHKLFIADQEMSGIVGYDSMDNLFITLAEQYGYGYTSVNKQTGEASLDFDNANMKGLLKTFNKAAQDGYLIPSSKKSGNSYCSEFFTKNQLLFNIGSTAGVSHEVSNSFDVNVAPLPRAAEGKRANISQGPSLCILRHSTADDAERQLAAWEFYKFLTTPQRTSKWAQTVGYLPVRTSALSTISYQEYANPEGKDPKSLELLTAKTAVYSSSALKTGFTNPSFKGSSTARSQVGALMTKVLLAKTETVTDAYLDNAFAEAVNAIKTDMD